MNLFSRDTSCVSIPEKVGNKMWIWVSFVFGYFVTENGAGALKDFQVKTAQRSPWFNSILTGGSKTSDCHAASAHFSKQF